MKYIIDTNSLINNPHVMEDKNVIITSLVLRELEKLELKKSDRNLQYGIRAAKRLVEENLNNGKLEIVDIDSIGVVEGYNTDYVDNKLVKYAIENSYGIITDDILLRHKAISMGVRTIKSSDQEDDIEYKGFVERVVSDEERKDIYTNLDKNTYGLFVNQYLILKDEEDEIFDVLVWDGNCLMSIYGRSGKDLSLPETYQFGKLTARDAYQSIAIDSFNRNQVTMIRGKAGSGKTLLSLNYAWSRVEKNNARLVIFFNPAPSKDSIEMGFFKGDMVSKALQSSLGAMLKSKFGGEGQLLTYIEDGTIEIYPFTDLRGWDSTSERETIVLISESQNLTSSLLKMGLQRIDDNTQVIIDGDYNQQVDRDVYLHSNGMKRASEVLRGTHLYGEVELQNVYRSVLASVVEEM